MPPTSVAKAAGAVLSLLGKVVAKSRAARILLHAAGLLS